jgi:ankyrin repeat protein
MKNHLFFLFFLSLFTCQIQGMKKCKSIFNRFLPIHKIRSPRIPLNEFHERALAFLMAGHPRLGAKSSARILPPELSRYILEQALPEIKKIQKWRRKPQDKRNVELIIMAEIGDEKQIKILLIAGAEKDFQDRWGDSPLHKAVLHHHKSAVQTLLAAGASKELKNTFTRTPLHEAASSGDHIIVQMLLDALANKEARTENGFSPLHLAAGGNHLAIVKTLIHAGANKEAVDCYNKRPLHEAAFNGHEQIVKALLDIGAHKNPNDIGYRTPLKLAKRNKHQKVVALLQLYGAR